MGSGGLMRGTGGPNKICERTLRRLEGQEGSMGRVRGTSIDGGGASKVHKRVQGGKRGSAGSC